MLVSLLEGEKDTEILGKMSFSLTFDDLKDRLLRVFGVFLNQHKSFPTHLQEPGQKLDLPALSKLHGNNCLASISLTRIKNRLNRDSFEGNIQEAFDIYNLI